MQSTPNTKFLTIPFYLIDIPQPFHYIFKTFFIRYIINQHNAHGAPIIRRSDRMETLLSRRIPYLQFDFLPPQLYRFNFKIYP